MGEYWTFQCLNHSTIKESQSENASYLSPLIEVLFYTKTEFHQYSRHFWDHASLGIPRQISCNCEISHPVTTPFRRIKFY